jgi:hypothetical protein
MYRSGGDVRLVVNSWTRGTGGPRINISLFRGQFLVRTSYILIWKKEMVVMNMIWMYYIDGSEV